MANYTREEITEKIKKLLTLAESSNVHEASLAAARAQELMDRYEIELSSLNPVSPQSEPIEQHSDFFMAGRIENWRGMLLNSLCDANTCKVWKRRMKYENTLLVVAGTKTNVQTVRYMFNALSRVVEQLSLQHRGGGKSFIASFKVGAATAICHKIYASKEATRKAMYQEASTQGAQALMRIDGALAVIKEREKELQKFLDGIGLNIGKGKSMPIRNRNGFASGMQAGEKVDIGGSKGLTSGAKRLNA